MSESEKIADGTGIRTRTMEIVVALIIFSLGALVVFDSHRLGSSWGSDGPEAGYFPFWVGLFIAISSAVIFSQAVWGRRLARGEVFVEWQSLRQVLAILIPATVYVLGIQVIGIYVASAIYIAGFMHWLGNYSWLKSVLLGVTVSAVAFVTFEVWFQVPLYKGAFDPLYFLGF